MVRRLLLTALLLLAVPALAGGPGIAWLERSEKRPVPLEAFGVSDFPRAGDTVHWTAHLYGPGSGQTGQVPCLVTWRINTRVEAVHTQLFQRAAGLQADTFAWTIPEGYSYAFDRPLTNTLSVSLSPLGEQDSGPSPASERQVLLEALPLRFKVSRAAFEKYDTPEKSCYEHLEEAVQLVNRRLGARTYPSSPHGIIDRFRIDRVEIVEASEDGEKGGDTSSFATVFLHEGPGSGPGGDYLAAPYYWICIAPKQGLFPQDQSNVLVHELGHALNFPDMYRFNMKASDNWVGHFSWQAKWADQGELTDVMRNNYNGEKSIFTECECLAINLFAGQLRRRLPEVYKGVGGWMMKWLPRTILLRTPEETEVKIYRGTGRGYFLRFEDTLPAFRGRTADRTFAFSPEYDQDAENINRNCFLVELPGGEFHVIDTIRLNFAYMQGQTNVAVLAVEDLQ